MNPNETRTLWISIGCALFAVFLLYSHSQEKRAEYDKRYGATKKVVVATEDINEMQTITEAVLDIVEKPVDFVEPSAVIDPQDIIGEVAAAPIKKGEQILRTKLNSPGPSTGIAMQIAPEKRAISVPIDETRAVSKLIRPGDRVDVIAVLDSGTNLNKRRESKFILQDIPVLATGLRVVNNLPRIFEKGPDDKTVTRINLIGDTKYSTITLELGTKEAQDMAFILATSPGSLFFVLRNPNDRMIRQMPTSSLETVLGRPDTGLLQQGLREPASLPTPPPAPAVTPRPANKTKPRGNFQEI